jgi:Ca2+-binding EF-hand superfamily protein
MKRTLNALILTALTLVFTAGAPASAQIRKPDPEELAKQFAKADKDSDGKLTLDEAKAGMPRVARRFDTLDKDKKGYVTLDQLKAALEAGGSK